MLGLGADEHWADAVSESFQQEAGGREHWQDAASAGGCGGQVNPVEVAAEVRVGGHDSSDDGS